MFDYTHIKMCAPFEAAKAVVMPAILDSVPEIQPVAAGVSKGSCAIRYEETARLTAEQEPFHTSYLNLYCQSLADLNAADPSPLFAQNAQPAAALRNGVREPLIAVRAAQNTGLSLTGYSYTLTCTEADAPFYSWESGAHLYPQQRLIRIGGWNG